MRSIVVVGRSIKNRLPPILKQKRATQGYPSHAIAEYGVISEVFSVFQTKLRTSRVSPGYRLTDYRMEEM
jgi:hypothetical protein